MKDLPRWIFNHCSDAFPCGSRVTCDPPPMDTDIDFLCLLTEENLQDLTALLIEDGWARGGSGPGELFQSYTKGNLNLILTTSQVFFDRFEAATKAAKTLNLMAKADRIMLFQAVLYGKFAE